MARRSANSKEKNNEHVPVRRSPRLAAMEAQTSTEQTDNVTSLPQKRKRPYQDEASGSVTTDAPKAKRPKTEGAREVPDHGYGGELLDNEEHSKTLGNDTPGKISKGKEVDNHHALDHNGDQGNSKQSIGTDFTKAEEPTENEEVNDQGYEQAGFPLDNEEDISKATGPDVPKVEESKGKEKANDHDHDGSPVDNQKGDPADTNVPIGEGTEVDNSHDDVPEQNASTIDTQRGEDPSDVEEQDSSEATSLSECEDLDSEFCDPNYLIYHYRCDKCEKSWVSIAHNHTQDDNLYSGDRTPPQGDVEAIGDIWQWI